jgi:hypothetical protein
MFHKIESLSLYLECVQISFVKKPIIKQAQDINV